MPGAYKSLFVVAFDLDRTGQAVPAFEPRQAPDDETAIAQARRLAESHAGAVAWKREAKPVVGEEGACRHLASGQPWRFQLTAKYSRD